MKDGGFDERLTGTKGRLPLGARHDVGRTFLAQVWVELHQADVAAECGEVQVFVENLRCTKTPGDRDAHIDILFWRVEQCKTRRHNRCVKRVVPVRASPRQQLPPGTECPVVLHKDAGGGVGQLEESTVPGLFVIGAVMGALHAPRQCVAPAIVIHLHITEQQVAGGFTVRVWVAAEAVVAVAISGGCGEGDAIVDAGSRLVIPRECAGCAPAVDRFGDFRFVRRQVEPIAAATRFADERDVCGEFRSPIIEEAIESCAGGREFTPTDFRESITVDVERTHDVVLRVEVDGGAAIIRGPIHGGIQRPATFGAGLNDSACRRCFARNDVDHATNSAGAVQRGAATFDHFDALDHPRGNVLDAVDLRERRHNRMAVHKDLRVRAFEAEQPNLREVAVLAVVLHAHT